MQRYCIHCNILLDDKNWALYIRKKGTRICRLCYSEQQHKQYERCKEHIIIYEKECRILVRTSVIEYYGGKCIKCGETNYDLLSLDHIDGNGRKHRKEVLKTDSGTDFYKWVNNNKPDNLQLLCYNCNCAIDMTPKIVICQDNNCEKNINNNCKHTKQIKKRNYYISLKLEVFRHYGNKCVGCSITDIRFLTMDHINNNGAQHRKEIGTQIFPWLKKNNYPTDFQILCFNCNCLKRNKNIRQK